LENSTRKSIDNVTKNILLQVPPKSKLFVIFPIKNNGSLNNILKYSLIPIKSKISTSNFENKTFQEMINIYSKYEYIWFVQFNNNLITKNIKILKQNSNKKIYVLYKIKLIDKNIELIPVI
jgi:hypothetical protein